jgi:hypothetical protein
VFAEQEKIGERRSLVSVCSARVVRASLIFSRRIRTPLERREDEQTLWYTMRRGGELPASIAFRGDLYLLFERGDIVRCHCRTWKDRDSGQVIHANGERWLTTTQQPKRIHLHSNGSPRAVAAAHLAAQGRWLCFRVVFGGRIIRVLCGQGTFHYSCAAIAQPNLGHRTKKLGYDYLAINRLWKKRLPGARSIATGSRSVESPTARRTHFHLAWLTAMYSAT